MMSFALRNAQNFEHEREAEGIEGLKYQFENLEADVYKQALAEHLDSQRSDRYSHLSESRYKELRAKIGP